MSLHTATRRALLKPRAAGGWWLAGGISAASCVAAYAAKGAASQAASYTNLANPGTYDAASGIAPTFDTATGWAFDGSTQYLDTGINYAPAWSVFVRFSDVVPKDGFVCGTYNGGNALVGLQPAKASNHLFFAGGGSARTVAGNLASGVMGLAGTACYLDGSSQGAAGGGVIPSPSVYIGGLHLPGGLNFALSCRVQAVAFYSTTLTAGQAAALYTAMAAL